jgi:hypothetical protein
VITEERLVELCRMATGGDPALAIMLAAFEGGDIAKQRCADMVESLAKRTEDPAVAKGMVRAAALIRHLKLDR